MRREEGCLRSVVGILLFIVLLPILLLVLPLYGLCRLAKGMLLKAKFRRTWGPKGMVAVLIYSDSPNWKQYIEREVLPRVSDRVVVVNWSLRSQWPQPRPIEIQLFEHWGGRREFNPMAIIVPCRGRVQTIRMRQAFRDLKHGNLDEITKRLTELFGAIDAA